MTRQVTLGCVATLLVSTASLTIAAGAVAGQSEKTASPVGVDAIESVLTGHKQWTFYWDRATRVRRPRLGPKAADRSPSATLEFMRAGLKVIGHAQDDTVHLTECEFEVAVGEGGFTFAGCWGSDKTMTYDPDDREYPFKGRTDGTLLWLAPSR
jgi:hypothetical protein